VPADDDDNDDENGTSGDPGTHGDSKSTSSPGGNSNDMMEVRRVYHPECLHCVASGQPLGGSAVAMGAAGVEESDDRHSRGDAPEVFFGDDDGLPYSEDA